MSDDFGETWKQRLEAARARSAREAPRLDCDAVVALRRLLDSLDVSCAEHTALFWSGKDVPTAVPMDADREGGPFWWDKYAPLEAQRLRALGLCTSVEDTAAGRHLLTQQLHYPERDPLAAMVRKRWDELSARFARAVTGRVEVIAEGAFADGVFRAVELPELLANAKVTSINGLDAALLPADGKAAYGTLRRWHVERAHRYAEFVASLADASLDEKAAARDDAREAELWYAQEFFELLGPQRELPALPDAIVQAVDQTRSAFAWKYSARWRQR